MNKNLHPVDELLLSALKEYRQTPGTGVKEHIEQELALLGEESRKKKRIGWKRFTVLCCLLLLGLTLQQVIRVSEYSKKINIAPAKVFSSRVQSDPLINMAAGFSKYPYDDKSLVYAFPRDASLAANQLFNLDFYTTEIKKTGGLFRNNEEQFTDFLHEHTGGYPDEPVIVWSISPERLLKPGAIHPASLPVVTSENITRNLSSQRSPEQEKKLSFSRWSFSIFASYERAGYRLDSDDPSLARSIRHNEIHEPSFSLGLTAVRRLGQHWELQTGLIFYHTDIGIRPQMIYAFQDPTGDIAFKYILSSGYTYIKPAGSPPPVFGDSLLAESKHTLKSIAIPLNVHYRLGKGKLTIAPGAGIETGFITTAKTAIELTDASNRETATVEQLAGTKKIYWSVSGGIEMQYQLNKKTSITLQPVFRQAISPITENSTVETFPRSFGIRAGLRLRL